MIKQKEAVFAAFTAGVGSGMEKGSEQLFNHVASSVQAGITSGEVEYGKNRADEKEVKQYSRSLTSNWFKKDDRIAGTKYVPATRRGPQVKDETLKALNTNLKALKAHNADMKLISKVESAIETRRGEIQTTKAASKVQDLDTTLASLKELGISV